MSDQVTVGEYSLEISGDEVVVRDESGTVVEEVKLDEVKGEFVLPDGKKVDLASIFADSGIDTLQTAAGPANDNLGSINGGPAFHAFHPNAPELGGFRAAGTLGDTSLDFDAFKAGKPQDETPHHPAAQFLEQESPVLVTWSSHDPWHVDENHNGGSLGKVIDGDPANFTFEVSDPRFEVVDGILQVRDGVSFDFENEPGIDLQITATSRTGDVKTLSTHIDINDLNEAPTDLTLDHAAVNENVPGAVIGTLAVADPDAGDSQSFKVSDDRFEVVDGQLKLKDGVSLDHESAPTLDVTVTATDNGGNQIQRTFTIQVGDVNEAQTALSLDSNTVSENAAGAVIGTLTVVDPDAGDSESFKVSDDRFEIVDGQLKLKDGVSLDHEGEPTVNVTVTATDGAGHQIQQTFAINVGDVNEAPTGISLSGNTLVENSAGAVIGALTAIDPDAGDTHTFDVSDNRFEVVDGQLKLKDGVSLDFETEPSLNIVVTATDSVGNKVQETFTLSVGDVNEAQTDLSLDHNQVMENAAGAIVGSLSVVDPDAGDSQSFTVSDNRFEVVNGQLKLKDGVSLDHEGEPTVNVEVTATDAGGHQITKTFAIDVTDVNEAQTSLTLSNNTVAENAKGAVIGNVLVVDPDAGDKQSYSVSDSRFQIVNGQLQLKAGVSINYESEPNVDVKVTATDKSGHQISQTFTINVGDVNEAQTGMTLSNTKVAENAAGAVVGTLNVADPDAGDTQSFKVSDARFEVVNGQLKLKDGVSLNYESTASINVKVTATDSANHQYSKTFTIGVQDVNEAQTAMTLTGTKVAENAAGAVIGTLKVTDPDKGDSQSYSVSDARFEVVNGQLKLKDGVSLDYEQGAKVNIDVTATDTGNHQITKTFTVNVTNVNEAQTDMTLGANSVKENAAGAVIGKLTVADPDVGDKQTFTVSDGRFEVVNNQLKLKPGVSLDFEQTSSVSVDVTATDSAGHQITKTFTVNVTDVNEAQTALTLDNMQVSENAPGAVIGTLSVADPDAGDTQSFKVSDNRFEVVNGQLKLKDGVSLNYEAAHSVNVNVTATDSANHQITKTFTINVDDVNEAQTAMTLGASKVAENAAGAVIGNVSVTDPDAGDSQSFMVSDNRFEVVNGQLKLKDGVSLDYEQASKISVDVTATDTANHQITKTFTITVTNVYEAQTDMTLSANSVKENAAGATIGKLTVTDPDVGDKQSFTVSDGRFEVVNNQLKLKAGVSLDFEQSSSVSVDVTATDKGGNQITKTFTVNVTDVNEAQTSLTLDNMQVAENTPGGVIGKLIVADQDAGDTQSFKVSDNRFEVVNGELKLKPGISFDHETIGSVDVTVTATDSAKHTISQTFTIAIGDVNEAQTGMSVTVNPVQENVAGAVVGAVSVTDPDIGDAQSFKVSDNRFEVVNGQLKLKDGISLDHEAAGSVDVTVTATDAGGHQISQTVSIAVSDVNEAQTSLSLSNSSVAENAAGAVVGTLNVADPDAGDSQSFFVSDNRFEVVNGQLKLKDGISLDHEGEPSVNVTVTATDAGGHQIQQTFAIAVGDINEAQTAMSLSNASVAENAAGAVVGAVTVVDPDAGDTQSFSLSDSRFEVVNGQLKLKDGVSLDHEGEPTVNVTVTATDAGGHQIQQTFAVSVTDVNEAQTGMSLSNASVAENAAGAVIGTVTVADPDAGDTQSFQVSDSRFEVVNNQLQLKSGVSLDHESEPTVNVTVTATDSAGHQIQQTFAVNVTDVNEAQTAMSLSNTSVAENAAGAVVGTVTVADPDAGDTQSFQVSDSRFEVVNNQLQLKSGVSLDHESEPAVNVTVTAMDGGGHQIQQTFAVSVTDVNEAQTGMSLSNASVAENAAGAVIGTVTVADPDAGDTQSFQVSDSHFEVVNNQLQLKSGVSLDHESEPTVNVTVTSTDTGGHQIQQTFAVNVTDVNEVQTGMSLSGSSVAENAAGAVIGTLSVSDPDAGDKQSFQVSDGSFEVVNNQLQLKSGVSLDYEQGSSVNVTVTATDIGNHQYSKTFTIGVADVNEAQTDMTLSASKVAENAAGAVIGTLSVSDPDAGDKQTFSVSDGRFEVVNNQLQLKSGVSLDFEQTPSVNVTVTATDQANHQYSKTFTIGVTDINEAQTGMSLSNATVAENAAGAVIGTLSVSDPDAGDKQTFSVSDSRFEVVNNQLQLKTGVSLDFEQTPSVNVTVTATDQANHQYSKTFTVGVTDVNEAQTGMSLSASKVAENSAGAVIGTLSVSDPDAGDKQSFSVSDGRFEVVNNQLKLKSGVSLDYEQASSVSVTVTATDTGNHQYAKTFTIGVTDVNEAPTAIQLSNLSVNENATGATVGTLTTTDPDAGDTFSYQVSDSRFQVVNGQLQLKSGVSLDHETEPTVSLKVTSTDSAGHSIQQSFTVNVANVNEAPTVTAKDGSYENHVINTVTTYAPVANSTVGAYLYSNDSAGVAKPASNLLNGFDPTNMSMPATGQVTATFQKEAAGNHNMVGTYQYDNSGNIIAGSVKFVWLDASANTEGQLGATMVKDFLGYSQSNTISLGTMAPDTHIGFFTISNGANDSGNKTLLTNAAAGTATQAAAMDAIAGQLSIKVDANGNGHVYVGNSQMNGDVFFTSNKSLNTDFNGSSDIDHFASGTSSSLAHQLVIGVEDLKGGGDLDYNDVVFSVDLGTGTNNTTTHPAVQPQVDFSDIDSSTLSQAVIHTSGFQAGDALNIPASSLFNVTVNHSTADYTITIVGKTGNETVDQYEDFANSISFSSSSKTEGDRHIDYTVTDSGGLTSTPATADIPVANSYEISSSQLGGGQNTLGSGNDLLHVNANNPGHVDMGAGYDTVHLATQGGSFAHNDAVKLENVEAIDATGYGANNVSLSINDVLNITDSDHHLTVIGEKGDTVTLSGDGSGNHWNVVSTDANFTTYAWSDPSHQAVVEISNQLNTQVS